MNSRVPDRLDAVLLAGYTFSIELSPSKELVRVLVVQPSGALLNPVYGPIADGALTCLDRAVVLADEHHKLRGGVL